MTTMSMRSDDVPPTKSVRVQVVDLLEGLRHLDPMSRPVGQRRERATDCATFSSMGEDLKIDLPGGSVLIPGAQGAIDEVTVLASAVEGMKRGIASLVHDNPVVVLSLDDCHLVLACQRVRARYKAQ
ncbi:hypothetical protein EEB11_04015 [Pseudotabrizicola sediminis]|uniref:Uncharacterized protein n=1 Tax=Pseudotabrizicola sediminis TaxID=2486418 RepID=A0ABY2KU33_9RHOB|nr:hypothetical protein EEB11_04015 [Pseudotabrizicola sediminis]